MQVSKFNRLVPGQKLIHKGKEYEIVKKEQGKRIGPVFLPVTFGGYEWTLKTRIAGQIVYCTTTTDTGDPDFQDERDHFILPCDTLGKVWESGDSGDLSI